MRGSWTCGPDGVLDRRRQPAHHRVADVFGRPIGIFHRDFAGDDRVLEARRLERRLPIENRLSNPRLPLIWRVRIDVVDDGLLRIAEIALPAVGALQTPARDESLARRHLLVRSEIDRAAPKKPMRSSARRGRIGCSGRRTMLQCATTLCAGRAPPRRREAPGRRRRRAGLRRLDLDVVREGDRSLDVRSCRIDRRRRIAANSGTFVVNSRVTSTTAALSGLYASTFRTRDDRTVIRILYRAITPRCRCRP